VEYFYAKDWTTQNTLKWLPNFVSTRMEIETGASNLTSMWIALRLHLA
jgi:hypothetical protein